jgi:hypothetical protein
MHAMSRRALPFCRLASGFSLHFEIPTQPGLEMAGLSTSRRTKPETLGLLIPESEVIRCERTMSS